MTPVELSRTVLHAVRRAVDEGELRVSVPERAVVTVPGPGGCGDYATNIALQLARPAGQPPRHVAEVIRARLAQADGVAGVEITGPGFLNIRLAGAAAAELVARILREGLAYGHGDALAGQVLVLRVPYEIRAEVVADAVARIARSQGARVDVEHEPGPRVNLRPSLAPAGGEHASGPRVNLRPTVDAPARADARIAGSQGARTAVEHDPEPRRSTPLAPADVEHASGPRVNLRPPAYAPAPAPADVEDAEQAPAPPATRATRATRVTLRPVPTPTDPTPLGPDAARWALLHPAPHDRPRISDEHLVQRESNPLFRVRYAHARTRALRRNAADLGFQSLPTDALGDEEPVLLRLLADHPRILTAAATHRAPDRLARHLVTVADAVLPFLPTVLPRGAEKPSAAHRARLALAEAAGTVLAGGLTLLGIDAPDHL
ncbi:ArgS-related anticodon-binding protein NrtL [Streptomyces griseosporeus]|uniref:ArgS-related anticodon-binding protein NrtL n=1 Tax=Streptomyces griseosporeus TaxID=1910 RepID=UPI0036879014